MPNSNENGQPEKRLSVSLQETTFPLPLTIDLDSQQSAVYLDLYIYMYVCVVLSSMTEIQKGCERYFL